MAVNDTWQLNVIGVSGGTQHIHTLHFRELGGDFTGEDLIGSWRTAAETAYRAHFASYDAVIGKITAQKVCGSVPLPAASEYIALPGAGNGTKAVGGDNQMPSFCAALVTERGTLQGRSRSGRFFLGGLFEADVDGNALTAGEVTRIQAYCTALKTAFIDPTLPDWRLVTHSRKLADTGISCELSSTPVGQLLISSRPTTMRSRKWGSGL